MPICADEQDAAERGEDRTEHIGEDDAPVDVRSKPVGRHLVRADGADLHAEARAAERDLADDDDERSTIRKAMGKGPILALIAPTTSRPEVAVGHGAEGERDALNGDEHGQRRDDGDRPTILIRTPLTRPTSAAAPIASEKPRTRSAVLCPSPMKNDRITTTSPVSGPTDKSMPPVSRTMSWPMLTKASALARKSVPLMLRSLRNFGLTPVV